MIYRIKTEEEFIEQFGRNYGDEVSYGWSEDMSHLFGKILTINQYQKVQNGILRIEIYSIGPDMVTTEVEQNDLSDSLKEFLYEILH